MQLYHKGLSRSTVFIPAVSDRLSLPRVRKARVFLRCSCVPRPDLDQQQPSVPDIYFRGLAGQHLESIKPLADAIGVKVALLTGSTRKKERADIHEALMSGELQILIGTHALIEDTVQFHNLGLAIIDEQHRFGVAQRARLWSKNRVAPPHVLVMTATPIPRTLAMTVYGDLDVSIIDELPPGRKPVTTVLKHEPDRFKMYQFVGSQLREGRQAFIPSSRRTRN